MASCFETMAVATVVPVVPNLYNYYTGGGIQHGLNADQSHFTLNDKEITLYSGALHYFRVPQQYWRDRLRKLKAAGLNTVETYVPWNLHEPEPGVYDFGAGGTDFQDFLDVKKFLEIAKEEDLFAIVRPGPYICAEWDFGGMPSWLLRDEDMQLRTSDSKFMGFVEKYFTALMSILSVLQFTKGGPIIAFQIENEYGNVKNGDEPIDTRYLLELKRLYEKLGLVELYFTSDTPSNGKWGAIPGVLYTANFQNNTIKELDLLNTYQTNKPTMVMEYWTGWFDHWGEHHHTRSGKDFGNALEQILAYPSSVNFYMFHGGTNWGFMNGGNILDSSTDSAGLQHDTSSYDYDAPLSEAGDYTEKYYIVRDLLKKYSKMQLPLPEMPKLTHKSAYSTVQITHMMKIFDIIDETPDRLPSKNLIPMEFLNINHNAGQSYGYIVYRKTLLNIPANSTLVINGRVTDTVMVLINGELVSNVISTMKDLDTFGTWRLPKSTLHLGKNALVNATLDLVVESWGRSNFGKLNQFNQKKGLWQGDVSINSEVLHDWEIVPLEFKNSWNVNLRNWDPVEKHVGPTIYKGELIIKKEPHDSFIDMREWTKGIVVVNGFVLSRYFRAGPQQTAYLPAPLLHTGNNEILIFEHYQAAQHVKFSDKPIFETL